MADNTATCQVFPSTTLSLGTTLGKQPALAYLVLVILRLMGLARLRGCIEADMVLCLGCRRSSTGLRRDHRKRFAHANPAHRCSLCGEAFFPCMDWGRRSAAQHGAPQRPELSQRVGSPLLGAGEGA